MDRRRTLHPIAVVGLALMVACQGSDSKDKGSPAAAPGIAGQSFSADAFSCKKKSKKKRASLTLLDDVPSWDGEIKAMMKAKCVSCHKPGGTPPDLSTYESTVEAAEESLESMERTGPGKMPPSGNMSGDEIATFKAWIDGGTPESPEGQGDEDGDADGDAATDNDDDGDDEASYDSEYDDTLCPNAAKAGGDDAGEESSTGGDASQGSASAGAGSSTAGGTANGRVVTYAKDIAPILNQRCVSCHSGGKEAPDLDTYQAAKAAGAGVAATVAAGTMPPIGGGLAQAERDLVAAWAAGNFRENAN